MPATTPAEMVDAIQSGIEASRGSSILTSARRAHPRKFAITLPDGSPLSLWIYIWTLTFGGRPSLPDEYRIQMTSVSSPLAFNPSGITVLLGYEPGLKVFAGFDLNLHREFTSGSPSVQVSFKVLRKAITTGLAFHRKSNEEIAIAIRPDHLLTYILSATGLHKHGLDRRTREMLVKATELEKVPVQSIESISKPRRIIVETVSRAARDANFRQQVMQAYDNRCAVTRMQLKLVEAAHILPVAAKGSFDHVRNGIALSPTYHRAYDAGLIYLTQSYVMELNAKRATDLKSIGLDGGLKEFESHLGKIHLPPNADWWPDSKLIGKANRFRSISAA